MFLYSQWRSWLAPILVGLTAFVCIFCVVLAIGLGRASAEFRVAGKSIGAPMPTIISAPSATLSLLPAPSTTESETSMPQPTSTLTPTRTATVPPTPLPAATAIQAPTHLILGRPVGPKAKRIIPDWTYLYGETEHGQLEVHHGQEFVNPLGTPQLAVADGTVVVAGNDTQPLCGDDGARVCGAKLNYYGNLVVEKLDQTDGDQAIFTLCGHMDTVDVKVGQHVRAGTPIGTVGMTGVAAGPHCLFEVRLGVDDYGHTRNPILWMKPLPGRGAVAGSVRDREGQFLPGLNVFLYLDNATKDWVMDTETYGRDADPSILPANPDDWLHENWPLGDLRAGQYLVRVQIGQENYYRRITIVDGQLTFVVFAEP